MAPGPSRNPQGGIQDLVRGDERALARIARLVRRIVAARAYWIPAADRADLTQEAMLQFWRAVSGPAAGRIEKPEGLAATIAHRCCLMWMRRRRRIGALPEDVPDPAPSSEADLIRRERQVLGHRVLQALPAGCREVLRLHILERLTYREIGQQLHRSEHGLRTQAYECLKEARALIVRMRREAGPGPGGRFRPGPEPPRGRTAAGGEPEDEA